MASGTPLNKAHLRKLQGLFDAENWTGLERLALSYIKADKREVLAWNSLATAFEKQGKDALSAAKMALKLSPDDAQALFNMGCVMRRLGKKQESVHFFRRAVERKPDYGHAWCNLGNALQSMGEPYAAMKAYSQGIKIAPNVLETQLNMGNCCVTVGEHHRATRIYQMALDIAEATGIEFIEANNAMLFAYDLMPSTTIEFAQAERRKWNAKFAAKLLEDRPHLNDRNHDRRLRVGYCSADFRKHSAARAFAPVILYHDREQYEVFAYHSSKHPEDDYTRMFKTNVDHWRDVARSSDQAISDMIREDRIDILVDLSGHTGGNRLLAFARKPAPIQCTGWGYSTGTGMPTVDVFFADEMVIPQNERHLYVEDIAYLPCLVGAHWVEKFPDVNELPALFDGNITFGSINRFAKVTSETLRLWARVLHAVPNSGMVLRAGELGEETQRARVTAFFSALGISSDRFILVGPADSWEEHMTTMNEIDICLDPIPHGGGVTTLETLMMGCPTITLYGSTIVARLTSSIQAAVGMPEWSAKDEDGYVALAIEKAKDLQNLAALRQGLRQRFLASPVGDGPTYARSVEHHYRRLWREWCMQQALDKVEVVA